MRYLIGVVAGVAGAVVGLRVWRSRLADELIRAFVSRGNPPAYRHRVRWSR